MPSNPRSRKNQTDDRGRVMMLAGLGSLDGRGVEGLALGDDDDPLLADKEAALPVVLLVVADGGVRGNLHVLVDDRPANAAVPSDLDAVEEDRVLDVGIAVHAHA